MTEIVHKSLVKARKSSSPTVAPSGGWLFVRRARLKVTEEGLICGDWEIPYSEIEEAVLRSYSFLWTKSYLLRLRAKDAQYEFGISPSKFWKGEIPFPIKRENSGAAGWVGNIIRIAIALFLSVTPPFLGIPLLIYWIYLCIR